jgi:hypothetical protein
LADSAAIVYATLSELDRFCECMELIFRDGLPS